MSSRTRSEIVKLIRYSESLNSKVSEDSREALRSLIDQGEAIGHLVQYYSHTQSFRALDLLCRIKEPHDTELCNRMQECFGKNPLATIILLGQIVQKAPSWLTKLTEHPLFSHILKMLSTTSDTVIMVGGVLFISSLMPHCSTLKRSVLQDLFRILVSACGMLQKKKRLFEKDSTGHYLESIHVSHLYCTIIQYFVILYGIYPNNLLEFLRECYTRQQDSWFLAVLEPVYGVVKFHPLLIRMNSEQELSRSRWSQREAHDFCADCRHVMVRPVIASSSHGAETSSPSRSESSAAPLNYFEFSPQMSGSQSSSNYQSNDSRWEESWSPSINLGLETPPGTRSATPIAQKTSVLSSSTIVPSSTGSQHSGDGSDDMRRRKRGSFSQKIADLVRGRKSDVPFVPKEREIHRPTLLERLEATKEENDDIEVIDASDTKSRVSVGSHVEEGIDAAAVHGSPVSTLSRGENANQILPLSVGIEEKTHASKAEDDKNSETLLYRSRSVSLAQDSSASLLAEKSAGLAADEINDQTLQDAGDVIDGEDYEDSPYEGVADSHSNRFSVTSFFRNVNRQRFISECPPKSAQLTCVSDDHRRKRAGTSANSRCRSCPDLMEEDELKESSQNMLAVNEAKKNSTQMALSVSTIAGLIEKEFPYLVFLRALPYQNIDEDAMDQELKREHERTRELYMEASLEHHKILKRMYLADRLPAKIYDDMSNLIQGLPLEKQREILTSRLMLVNQHLMYERSGRLLHAERNRRLFGRIKQQKQSDVEKITLQRELHTTQLERQELVNALSGLRKAGQQAMKERQDSEARHCEKLKSLAAETEKYKNELDSLRRQADRLMDEKEKLQKEMTGLRRRYEDAEVLRKLTDAKVTVLEGLRAELQKAHETNQMLRDKVALCELKAKKQGSGISAVLPGTAERDERIFTSQIEKLKKDLKNEQNAHELLKVKKAEVDEELRTEKTKCVEFKGSLERAAMVHKQQSEAAQHKYLSLLSVCQKQQAHILELCAYIEQQASRRLSPSTDAGPLPIPRGTVPEEILSYESTVGSETTSFLTDVFSPMEPSNANGLFEFSPGPIEDLTEDDRPTIHSSRPGRAL